jgi:hypothetical protein
MPSISASRSSTRVRPVQPERVGEPTLEQAVAPGHDLGDVTTLRGEDQLLAPADLDVTAPAHALDRLGHCRGRDAHVLGQPGADHRLAAAGQIVDRRQVVLDRGGGVAAVAGLVF